MKNVNEKFIDSIKVNDYEVLTDTGWENIEYVHTTVMYQIYKIYTDNHTLECADDHIIFDENMNEIFVKDIKVGSKIQTKNGIETVRSLIVTNDFDNMYDLELSPTSNKRYFTNGILSHNTTSYSIYCLWFTLFNNDKKVLIAADKEETAIDILGRIRLAYEYLPLWIKPGVITYNKGSIEFSNGSKIEGVATTENSGIGKSCNCIDGDSVITIADKRGILYNMSIEHAHRFINLNSRG